MSSSFIIFRHDSLIATCLFRAIASSGHLVEENEAIEMWQCRFWVLKRSIHLNRRRRIYLNEASVAKQMRFWVNNK